MQITIAAATRLEIQEDRIQQKGRHNVTVLYTGVGMLASAVSLTQHALQQKPDLIIQAGIGGSFDKTILSGNVVIVKNETLGDTGVNEKMQWKDLFDMGFQKANDAPFTEKSLPNEWLKQYNILQLPEVTGVTINQITTGTASISMLQTKYGAQIESMEGASLHYVCRLLNIPFIQLRAISNYAGERDKSKWKIKEAVDNLNDVLVKMVNGDL